MTFSIPGQALPQVAQGRLRVLAVTSKEPSALAPGVPPLAQAGLPGYSTISILGVVAAAKTPEAIINRLNSEINRYLRTPEAKDKMFAMGSEVVGGTPQQYADLIKSDIAVMGKVIRDAGIKAD
jgi:tripartite-type tricarboxylate transporter receptor subunit TctC